MTVVTQESTPEKIYPDGPLVAVLDYGMSNLRSVCKAWEYVGARVLLVDRPDQMDGAQALIFPGQGAMADCMKALERSGFAEVIRRWIAINKPFFGICLGLQTLFEHSEEGDTPGLGIFPGRVKRFRLERGYKIPHMGWNAVRFSQDYAPNARLHPSRDQFYFVHSYHVLPEDRQLIWCETDYGYRFVSGIAYKNCFATQFHPEKSQARGLQIYRNFVVWIKEGLTPLKGELPDPLKSE